MTSWRKAAEDYIELRRSLGFKLLEAKVALMAKYWRSSIVEEMLKRAAADAARPDGLPLEFGWGKALEQLVEYMKGV